MIWALVNVDRIGLPTSRGGRLFSIMADVTTSEMVRLYFQLVLTVKLFCVPSSKLALVTLTIRNDQQLLQLWLTVT
jgi:hypothetical protein